MGSPLDHAADQRLVQVGVQRTDAVFSAQLTSLGLVDGIAQPA